MEEGAPIWLCRFRAGQRTLSRLSELNLCSVLRLSPLAMMSAGTLPPTPYPRQSGATSAGLTPSGSSTSTPVVLGVAAVSSVLGLIFVIVLGLVIRCFYVKRGKKRTPSAENDLIEIPLATSPQEDRRLSLAKIKQLTNDFKITIGQGEFGSVYYGKLPSGKEIAVKVSSPRSGKDTAEFCNEVDLLNRIQHPNVISLLGFCQESDQQLLLFEYMSGGSLSNRLYGQAAVKRPLRWKDRLRIACDAARGLEYLHCSCYPSILHRDLNTSNILLDTTLAAKLAQIGLPKVRHDVDKLGTTVVTGTPAYVDPEYYSFQHLSEKSDVYSFGVVLLEMVCGRPPTLQRKANGYSNSLIDEVKPLLASGEIEAAVDLGLEGVYSVEALWKVMETAVRCVAKRKIERPSSTDVLRDLEDALAVENKTHQRSTRLRKKRVSFNTNANVLCKDDAGRNSADFRVHQHLWPIVDMKNFRTSDASAEVSINLEHLVAR